MTDRDIWREAIEAAARKVDQAGHLALAVEIRHLTPPAAMRPAEGWRPIETAPKKHRPDDGQTHGPMILLASTSGHRAIGYWGCGLSGSPGWVNPHDHHVMRYWNAFTHWMPLPADPAHGGEDE